MQLQSYFLIFRKYWRGLGVLESKKYLQVFSLQKEVQAWGSGGWYWEVSCQLINCQIQPVEFGEFTQRWRYLTSEIVHIESPEMDISVE